MPRKHQFAVSAVRVFCIATLLIAQTAIPMASVGAISVAPTDTQTGSIATNLGIYGGNNWDIAVDGDHVYTIADGVPNGFFYSSDAGAIWQRPAGTNDLGSGRAVEVDLATHAVYVALEGLYKSTDYGATLTKIADNVGNPLLFAQGTLFGAYNDMAKISADNGATFTSVTIASGENIMGYAASPTAGTFYAVTRGSGDAHLYVSTNSGASWSAVTLGTGPTAFTNVSVKPTDANLLVLSNDNYLWKSMDAGANWILMNTAPDPDRSCGNFSVWTSMRWYACAGYTIDNGATWTDMDMHTNVMRGPGKIVVFNPSNESILYGDCMSGVCKSTDGGLTWANSLNGITGVNVLAISQTTNKETVWISSSNGLGKSTNFLNATPTWTWPILPCDNRAGHRCDSSGIGESVWVKPDNANIVLAGSIGGWIYRSTDGGTTWTNEVPAVIDIAKFKTGSNNNLRPQQFINDPNNSNIVYVAVVDPVDHNGAVLKSTDAGITWIDLGITDNAPATRLAMSKTGVLYAGTGEGKTVTDHKGIYKYESGAWTLLTGIDSRLNINSVMVDPETQTTVYATASNDLAPLSLDGFFKSTNSGATWTKVVPTGYLGFNAITVQKSTAPNTLYMSARDTANHGVLLKSSDQGATWGTLYTGLKSESFTTVLFDGLVVGSKHGMLSLKSRASFVNFKTTNTTVRKNRKVTITATFKDAATKKLLKNKTIGLYQLNGKKWKLIRVVTTDVKKATISTTITATKSAKYRYTWTPSKGDRSEYTGLTSKTVSITVKK